MSHRISKRVNTQPARNRQSKYSLLYVCNGEKAENKKSFALVAHYLFLVHAIWYVFSVILSPWKHVVQLPLYINNFQLLFSLLKYCVPARKAFSEKVPPEIEFAPLHNGRFPMTLSKNKLVFLFQIFKLMFSGFCHRQPITQAALPCCIAIEILWNRKKVDIFSLVVSWIFLPICLTSLTPWGQ